MEIMLAKSAFFGYNDSAWALTMTLQTTHPGIAGSSVFFDEPGGMIGVEEKQKEKLKMAVVSMKQLLEAGVHFGHQTRRWNPKMAPYIYTERNGIYIIDLQKTVKKLEEAYNFVREISANGGYVLFLSLIHI